MRKSILRASAGLQALALLGAGTAASFIAAAPAAAQEYTTGQLTGTVTNESGAPIGGAAVTIRSLNQGFTRTTTTGANGNFTFTSLPAGDYDVTVQAADSAPYRAQAVQVIAGRGSEIPVVLTSGTAASGEVVVVGRRIQAFTGTTTGLNVDVEEITKTVPVGRNLTSIVLLAPSTSRGDAAFGNLASIGGGSVAENAYYVNGLNITNFDNYLGSATVPFDFYKTVEVKAGGYPAEFGRATGGIVNAVTKAGTNEWIGALHLNWAPEFLREDGHDITSCDDDGCSNITYLGSESYDRSLNATIEAGGPILRDRLFVYGLLQLNRHHYQNVNPLSATAFRYENDDPFWGAKIDAYPIDNHHLEFTIFDTRNTTFRTDIPFTLGESGEGLYGVGTSVTAFKGGGVNYVAKYTGRFTDWLTVSGAYGRMRDRFDYGGIIGAAGEPYVRNVSGDTVGGVDYLGYYTGQRVSSVQNPYSTQRKFYRGDVDVLVDFFGSHHFRGGFDIEMNTLTEATVRSGNSFLCANGYLTLEACNFGQGGAGAVYLIQPGNQVEVNYYNTGGSFEARNDALYLQDEWNVTDRLTINAGIRRDNFRVNSSNGNPLAVLRNNWAPRIGLTYDLWPDKRGKLKAFYGQYFLPFASNTAYRMTGTEYYFQERYELDGFDQNGVPILGDQITDRADYQSECPFLLTPQSSGEFCAVTGNGSVPETDVALAHNLKATKETEWILGYEHKFGDVRTGINFIYRKLNTTAEDMAIDAAVREYCEANDIEGCDRIWTGFHQYVVANPGTDLTVTLWGQQLCTEGLPATATRPAVDPQPGACDTVTFDAAGLGYPKAKRTYKALEFTFDRPYDGVWSLGGSYTLSWSKGNSEGFVQSDFGQDDAGITQDFDQPGFTDYSYGYLPNDRRHRIKLFGAYTLWDRLTLGGNFTLESPRSLSCFGFHPTDYFAQQYGAASHFCGGEPAPRGTAMKTDWISQLDAKVAYRMPMSFGEVVLRADIFNVFNSQAVQNRYEFGDLDIDYVPAAERDFLGQIETYYPDPNFRHPIQYQSPRSIRLGLDVLFGGVAPPPPPVEVLPPPPPVVEAPATQTCPDGTVILATAACPAPPPPPPPPPPAPERG